MTTEEMEALAAKIRSGAKFEPVTDARNPYEAWRLRATPDLPFARLADGVYAELSDDGRAIALMNVSNKLDS